MVRHRRQWLHVLLVCGGIAGFAARAQAQPSLHETFQDTVPGGVTFTGNTLGLSGGQAGHPGNNHSVGVFVSRNQASPGEIVGTTFNWQENGSGAVLRLPANATVLYAELIWAATGRVQDQYLDNSVLDHRDDPVSLTLPSGRTVRVAPEVPADMWTDPLGKTTYYTNRAEVTRLIRPYGAGTYIVGGVPAVLDARSSEVAVGWTLAVVYSAPDLPLRSISLRTGLDPTLYRSGVYTTLPSDFALFCRSANGRVKLHVSAMEGDSNPERDVLTMAVDAAIPVELSGPNNRQTNFFGSQINGDDGAIDTSGWFGDRNHDPWPTPAQHVFGGRQGWDITALDLTDLVPPAAANLRIVGGDGGGSDEFLLVALALEAEVAGPAIDVALQSDRPSPQPGQSVTYTATIANDRAAASGVQASLDLGVTPHLELIAGSVVIDGRPSSADPTQSIQLPDLIVGARHTVQFQARVLAAGASVDPIAAWVVLGHRYADCTSNLQQVRTVSNVVRGLYGPALRVTAGIVPLPIRTFDVVTVEYGIENVGGQAATDATLSATVPAGTTYVPGSTRLDGVSVADVGGAMPFSTAQAVPGGVAVGQKRRLAFQVRVERGAAAIIASIVTDLDGAGPAAPEATNGTAAVDNREPPLYVYIAGPGIVTPGDTFAFTAIVNNFTLDPISGLTVDFDLPAGVTFAPDAGCAALPCALPALAPGAQVSLPVRFAVANPFPDGTLTATARVRDGQGTVLSLATATISLLGRARYFAEGASNAFFTTEFSVVNPTAVTETIKFRFLRDNGDVRTHVLQLAPLGRVVLDPQRVIGEELGAFSTVVESSDTIGVERVMTWDAAGYGSSADNGVVSPGDRWYFAEGATGVFQLFYLLENPDTARASDVRITYLRANLEPIVQTYRVTPNTRLTIPVNEIDGLQNSEVSAIIDVTNGVPIVADRAMYRSPEGQPFGAGHASSASRELSSEWYFGEGATGTFFDTYLLLANPQETDIVATVRYQLPGGANFTKDYTVGPHRRLTVDVEGEDPRLAATAVAMSVTATQPIVAERAMWWPGPQAGTAWWSEAHAALGATQTASQWAVASGANGGPSADATYVLISNASDTAGEVALTLVLDNQTTATKTLPLAARERLTVDMGAEFPQVDGHSFSLIVQGQSGADGLPLVVERAHYASPDGAFWAAGDVTLATPVP